MKRKILSILLLILSTFLIIFAQLKHDVIYVGIDSNFWPMTYKSNNSYTGFDIDLANQVFNDADLTFKFEPINWNEKDELMSSGSIDCIWSGFSYNQERANKYRLSTTYLKNNYVIVAPISFTLDTLKEKSTSYKVGVHYKTSASYYFENSEYYNLPSTILYYATINEALSALNVNEIDFIITDEIYATAAIKNELISYEVTNTSLGNELFSIAFSSDIDDETYKRFNDALKNSLSNGVAESISEKWFNANLLPQ